MRNEKNGRISAAELARRAGAVLFSLLLVIGLLPLAALAETSEDGKFKSTVDPGQPEGYSDDMANPYGYGKGEKFLLSEENELLLYYSYLTKSNSQNQFSKWFDNFQPYAGGGLSLSQGKGGFDTGGDYADTQAFGYVAAVGFDPHGTGRKDHVAYVGYENGQQTIEGTAKYKGYVLWVVDAASGAQYGPWKVSDDSCGWLQSNNADLYAGSNFFNIIAGDFDADGKDDLVVSVVNDDQSYGLSQYHFERDTGLRTVMQTDRNLLHPEYGATSKQGNQAKDKLSMDFAVGDFNGDGIDDFAVLSYLNYGSNYNRRSGGKAGWGRVELGLPYLSVAYGASGGGSLADRQRTGTYVSSDAFDYSDHTSMYCGTIAAGDIDNDGKDEILAAGYKGDAQVIGDKLSFGSTENGKLLYASFYGSGGSLTAIEYAELGMNAWTQKDNGRTDGVGAKLMIEAFAAGGDANPDSVFISGDVYCCGSSSNKLDQSSGVTVDYFSREDTSTPGGSVGKSYIASIAVGNFEGIYDVKGGGEQVAYVVGLQRSGSKHQYSFSVHMTGLNVAENGYYNVKGGYIFYDQEFGLDKRPNCVIAAIDRDQDGILASYKGSGYAWSDPQVRAILQASPYFAELNDGDNGLEYLYDSPETEYAVTVTYSYETSSSNSVSFGIGFAGEVEGGGVSASLQAGAAFDWTEAFTKSLETEVTNSFKAGAYDAVVLCRTPVFLYNYDISYFNEDGDLVQDVMEISVPKAPVYEQLTIPRYNEFAEYYNGLLEQSGAANPVKLETIGEDLYLGHEGDPFGYYQDDRSGALPSLQKFGDLKKLTTSAGMGSVEYNYAQTIGHEVEIAHGFTFDLCIMGGFGVGGASAKAGGYVSLEYMRGHSVSTTNGSGITLGGTVMGLDEKKMEADGLNPDGWTFSWRLATWDSNLKAQSGYVPIIGYALSGLQAPPVPVEDLKMQFTRSSEDGELSFDLSWDPGDIAGSGRPQTAGYCIYLYDIAEDTYKLVETIQDPETTEYRYRNFFDGREYYRFAVTAFCEAGYTYGSLESAPRSATYYMSTADGSVLKIEKTGTDGLVDTYTIYFADGTTQTFTVTNGNGIISIALLSSDPETGVDTYEITFADGSTTTFPVTNGEKGAQGEPGAEGVGVDRIEKLRTEGNTDVYAVYLTDGSFYTFTVTNGKNGADGKDGLDGKNGADGKDGSDGKDGLDGKNGANGTNGKNGTDGKDGQNGKDGQSGSDGTDGIGISDIRIDENGNFIFTLSDGSQINAGSVPVDSAQAEQLAQAKADISDLQQQVQGQRSGRTIAILGVILASASLLWQVVALVLVLLRAKKKGKTGVFS